MRDKSVPLRQKICNIDQHKAMKSFYSIFQKVIVQPRDTNFAICMWFEVLVKHWNEALSTSFILLQTLDFNKASNSNELISWFEYQWHILHDKVWKIPEHFHFLYSWGALEELFQKTCATCFIRIPKHLKNNKSTLPLA